MANICKLILENFQSHKYTELELSDGLNVIIGASDHGKSAIIRAIKWVLYNEPRGTEFIRSGTNYARVTILFDNGNSVIRERTQTKNRYIIVDDKGNESIFEGFGNQVPDEVINIHGICKINLDENVSSNINISQQLEGAFLVLDTGATKAKVIGKVAYLDIIDNAITDCKIDIKRQLQTRDKLNAQLEQIELEMENYKGLDTLQKAISEGTDIIDKLKVKLTLMESFKLKKQTMLQCEQQLNSIKLFLKHIGDTGEAHKIISKCMEKISTLAAVLTHRQRRSKTVSQAQYLEDTLSKIGDTKLYERIFEQVLKKSEDMKRLEKLKSQRYQISENVSNIYKRLEENKKQIKINVESYIGMLRQSKMCPLCNNIVDVDKIRNIVGEQYGLQEE